MVIVIYFVLAIFYNLQKIYLEIITSFDKKFFIQNVNRRFLFWEKKGGGGGGGIKKNIFCHYNLTLISLYPCQTDKKTLNFLSNSKFYCH